MLLQTGRSTSQNDVAGMNISWLTSRVGPARPTLVCVHPHQYNVIARRTGQLSERVNFPTYTIYTTTFYTFSHPTLHSTTLSTMDSTLYEVRIVLVLKALESSPKLSIRATAKIYNVSNTTL